MIEQPGSVVASTVVSRLESLEQENRKLRRHVALLTQGGLAALVVVGLVGMWFGARSSLGSGSATAPVRTIEAESFVVRGADGKPQVILGQVGGSVSGESPDLGLLFFADGKPRGGIALNGQGFPVLTMTDAKGQSRVILSSSDTDAGLELMDIKGEPRIQLKVAGGERPLMTMYASNLRDRFQLHVDGKGVPGMDFFDRKGEIASFLDAEGRPLFSPTPKPE